MLAHEDEYKTYITNRYYNSNVTTMSTSRYKPGKFYVHYYLILKIFENKKVELTEEMKSDVLTLYANNEEA